MTKKEKEIDGGVDNDIELSEIQDIVKNFGLGAYAGDDERLKTQFIPFGIPGLDTILGGGIPRNRFTMLGGDTAVGKSFLAIKLIANAQKLGCSAIYFNVENKFSPEWFATGGVDIKKLIVVQGNIMESVWDSMIAFAEKGVDLVILDSLAALVPTVMEEAAMADQASYTGKHAYMVAKGFQKIMPALSMSDRKTKTAFLFLNQIRENIRMSPFAGGGDVIYPGGKSIEHYCSIKARVRRGEWDQETKKDVTTRKGFQIICFPAGTKILTKNNKYDETNGHSIVTPKNIEDIVSGDFVLSYNEITSQKEFKRVRDSMKRIADSFLVLKFDNGNELILTDEHPVFVAERDGRQFGEWVSSNDLHIGDGCIQSKYSGLEWRISALSKRGKTHIDLYGSDKAELMREVNSSKHMGKIPAIAGHTNVDFFGEKEANRIKNVLEEKVYSKIRGNALESIYGCDEASKIKQKHSVASKASWSDSSSGLNSDDRNRKISECRKEIQSTEEWKINHGKIMRCKWSDQEWRERNIDLIVGASHVSPNNSERLLTGKLDKWCFGEFEFNGDGRVAVIDRMKPDFINLSKKKVILFHGCYFHSCDECSFGDRNGISAESIRENDAKQEQRYLIAGYQVLTVWEHELFGDEGELKKKVLTFLYNPNIDIVKIISIDSFVNEQNVYNIEVEDNNNYFAHGILVHNCRTEKNQVHRPFMEATIPFLFTGEIDAVASLALLAQDLGMLTNEGASYFFKGEKIAYGWLKCLELFRNDKAFYDKLYNEVVGRTT